MAELNAASIAKAFNTINGICSTDVRLKKVLALMYRSANIMAGT